ncbi:MAG: zinc ribbon domain-containing protein [Anaerolineae bacterium]|uniref:zinc ribbon domain-containing protein n=1 Tax=Thermoflexus sp. TaxID=1969742 RepID=UPI0025CDD6EF|nr:zinc ribbon domain-containing protein [Thermoflexus sp.]MCS7351818.1 zinc ribbon domain-containing protein [Thermoflexus sp.]MDW8181277.1 zinc ribbon domain-containing protein [Anaerolineae bacterium]
MSDQRVFHAPNLNMGQLVQALSDWYRAQKFDVQVLDLPQGGVVIQARQEEAWRTLMGVSSALNVVLRRQGENLMVEVGAGKWVDKAIAAGAGLFLLWPLLFTAAYGAWRQSKLPQRTFEFIQQFIATGAALPADTAAWLAGRYQEAQRYAGETPAPPPPTVSPTLVPTPVSGEAAPAMAYRFCPNCGAELPPGARFCPSCGMRLGEGGRAAV